MQTDFEATPEELTNLRQALDVAAIVVVTDSCGTITHVNDKFCETSKYSREELIGQNHRIVKSGLHPHQFYVNLWRTISGGQVWEGEICNRTKDGTLYWVNACIVPFLDERNQPYQYVSIRYEITHRKEAEAQLVSYSKKLEQSNQELENFASIAAHDLQEPLRKIQSFSRRLTSKYAQILGDGLDYLERMGSAAARMQCLIDDLLVYSRLRNYGKPFGEVDLNLVIRNVLSDLEDSIEKAHARISISKLPNIDGDVAQMHQLFQNLISNAIKFRDAGRACEISVSVNTFGNHCVVVIRDNGIGFDEKYLTRIFNIFQRLHGRSEYPGSGVGLAVCRRIVDRHNGQITAKSMVGQGASFLVTLPVRQKAFLG
jgi:PAS domain S-box-containing protein